MRRVLASLMAASVIVLTPVIAQASGEKPSQGALDKAAAEKAAAADKAAAEKTNLDKIIRTQDAAASKNAAPTDDVHAASDTHATADATNGGAPAPATPSANTASDKPGEPLNLRPAHTIEPASPMPTLGLGTKLGLAALIGGAAYFVYRRRTAAKVSKIPALRITARASIGARTEVCVVEIDGQRLLLGVTPSSIRTLTALTDEPMIEQDVVSSPVEAGLARLFAAAKRSPTAETDDETMDMTTPSRPSAIYESRPAASNRQSRNMSDDDNESFRGTHGANDSSRAPMLLDSPRKKITTLRGETPKTASITKKPAARRTAASVEGQVSGLLAARSNRS